jgi:hypothetical protein
MRWPSGGCRPRPHRTLDGWQLPHNYFLFALRHERNRRQGLPIVRQALSAVRKDSWVGRSWITKYSSLVMLSVALLRALWDAPRSPVNSGRDRGCD